MKKQLLATALVAAIGLGGVTGAAAWNQRGGGYWNNNSQVPGPRMQMHYNQVDPAVQEKLDKFFADTEDLHKQIITKRAEQQALLSGDNPDPAQVGTLEGALFDLHTAIREKADEAGVSEYLGPRGRFMAGGSGKAGFNRGMGRGQGGRFMNDTQPGPGPRGRW